MNTVDRLKALVESYNKHMSDGPYYTVARGHEAQLMRELHAIVEGYECGEFYLFDHNRPKGILEQFHAERESYLEQLRETVLTLQETIKVLETQTGISLASDQDHCPHSGIG